MPQYEENEEWSFLLQILAQQIIASQKNRTQPSLLAIPQPRREKQKWVLFNEFAKNQEDKNVRLKDGSFEVNKGPNYFNKQRNLEYRKFQNKNYAPQSSCNNLNWP